MTTTEPPVDLGDRTTYLGGSDMAAILGIHPYQSRLECWRFKRGITEGPEENEAMRMGTILEPVVANEFSVRTGKKLHHVRKPYVDLRAPMIRGHVDRLIAGEDAILEIKTTGEHNAWQWGKEGTDDIPRHHIVQVQTYMMLTKRSLAYVAVLIGGNKLRTYTVQADPAWHDVIRTEAKQFWRMVEDGTEPEPADDAEAARRWTKHTDRTVALTPDLEALLAQRRDAAASIASAKTLVESLDVSIKNQMEDAEAIVDGRGRKLVTWRTQERRTLDTKAIRKASPEIAAMHEKVTTSRVFRVAKGGES